jgi:hypothetical protein
MSGAVAAHAAYNGSGTQGLAVTNKVHDDEGDVMSVFWNKNDTTRQLLYGSSVLEIPTSGGGSSTFGNSQIFTVNNDIDCLGDMFAEVTLTVAGGSGATVNNFGLAAVIDRVEFQVGTQIWQTLENSDLISALNTELTEGAYERFAIQANGYVNSDGSHVALGSGRGIAAGGNATAYIPLPTLSKTLGPSLEKFAEQTEDGYPMAAAPHQSVKIKLSYGAVTSVCVLGSGATASIAVKLYAQHMIMCNEERQQMKSMPQGLPKRLKMTQNSSTATPLTVGNTVNLDLDHFSLYASHLIISVDSSATSTAGLATAELKLNSSSFSGILKGPLLDGATAESLGLYNNQWYAPGNGGAASPEAQGIGYYVFPLASRAFGGSSVPLNRFDNIRLSLTFSSALPGGKLNVTCCGETTALFKGGAASLAMY